jgi:hypothetical protein
MEEGEQVPHAALGDVFLWMDSEELTLLRALLRLRNTARFWERMVDRSSLRSSEGSQMAPVIAKSACDLSLLPLLKVSALASPGWPCEKRPYRILLGFSLLAALLAAALIPFHGCKISDPKLLLQGCQFASNLQEADGIGIAQHRRADRLPAEPRSLTQPQK